jgi:LuxR family quorum sensing-dependent transcriptional regulator
MTLEESIAAIEACNTIDELKTSLHHISEDYGFASFNFLDTGAPHLDAPFHIGTLKPDFLNGYIDNKLIHVDPCIPVARRTNIPFSWGEVPIPQNAGVRKSGSQKTMEFAYDHGYQEGFIVPFHYSDPLGRINSSLIVFYWSSKGKQFKFLLSFKRYEMHFIMIYWAQRAVDIIGDQHRDFARFTPKDASFGMPNRLTDRERYVLS